MKNASNISNEEVIYEFDHQDDEYADSPMFGAQTKMKDLKPVKPVLERTPNFPRSSEGLEPLKLRVVFKRNQPFENQVITQVATCPDNIQTKWHGRSNGTVHKNPIVDRYNTR